MPNLPIIVYPLSASKEEKFASKEIRRYIYLRTSVLLPLLAEDVIPEGTTGFIVAYQDHDLIKKLIAFPDIQDEALREQSYNLRTLTISNGKWLVVSGGRKGGLLYAAYRVAEHFGIRFSLHGDIVPDQPFPFAYLT